MSGLREATRAISTCSSPPARRRTSRRSASTRCDAIRRVSGWRTQAQIGEGRSWVWLEGGTILFKAEASAWTPRAVQLQQVWVDPGRGGGLRQARARDLCRRLLERTPTVCLFVRADNGAAIRLYETIGMRRTISYRSLIF